MPSAMGLSDRLDQTTDHSLSRSHFQRASNVRNALYLGAAVAAPLAKTAIAIGGFPGLDFLSNVVESIFKVAEQINFNKRQSMRLATEARKTFEALKQAISRNEDILEQDPGFSASAIKFSSTLHRVEEKLKEVSKERFIPHLLRYKDIADDLGVLERDCQLAYGTFMLNVQVDIYAAILQSEKARKEDRDTFVRDLSLIKSDTNAMMTLMTKKGGALDQESLDALQLILHRIDNQPEKVLPAIRDFAETVTKTLKSQTNVDLPRRPPWVVSGKDFARGEKIEYSRYWTSYKAVWKKSGLDVVMREMNSHDLVKGLLEETVRWRELDHNFLHAFLAAQPVKAPQFFIYKLDINIPILDYVRRNREVDRLDLVSHLSERRSLGESMRIDECRAQLLQASLGLEYLHRMSVVHGDLRCANILVNGSGHAILSNFGLPRFFPSEKRLSTIQDDGSVLERHVHVCGSVYWMAPECLEGKSATLASDMWSFSCTAYELLTNGLNPFRQYPEETLWQELVKGFRPSRPIACDGKLSLPYTDFDDLVWEAINRGWLQNPEQRTDSIHTVLRFGVRVDIDDASLDALVETLDHIEVSLFHDVHRKVVDVLSKLLQATSMPSGIRSKRINLYFKTLKHTREYFDVMLDIGAVDMYTNLLRFIREEGSPIQSQEVYVALSNCFYHESDARIELPEDLVPLQLATLIEELQDDLMAFSENDNDIILSLLDALYCCCAEYPPSVFPQTLIRPKTIATAVDSLTWVDSGPLWTDFKRGLEFLTIVAQVDVTSDQWASETDLDALHDVLLHGIQHKEAYVRRSALQTISAISNSISIGGSCLQSVVTLEDLGVELSKTSSEKNHWPLLMTPSIDGSVTQILERLPGLSDIPLLLRIINEPLVPWDYKTASLKAILNISNSLTEEQKIALDDENGIVSAIVKSCTLPRNSDHEGQYSVYEPYTRIVIMTYSTVGDLPRTLAAINLRVPLSELISALARLKGVVTWMDEKTKETLFLSPSLDDNDCPLLGLAQSFSGLCAPNYAPMNSSDGENQASSATLAILDTLLLLCNDTSTSYQSSFWATLERFQLYPHLIICLTHPFVDIRVSSLKLIQSGVALSEEVMFGFVQCEGFLCGLGGTLQGADGDASRSTVLGDRAFSMIQDILCVLLDEREDDDLPMLINADLTDSLLSHLRNPDANHVQTLRVTSLLIGMFSTSSHASDLSPHLSLAEAASDTSLPELPRQLAVQLLRYLSILRHLCLPGLLESLSDIDKSSIKGRPVASEIDQVMRSDGEGLQPSKSRISIEAVLIGRHFLLLDYLKSPILETQDLGLRICDDLMKSSVDQKRAVMNVSGLREVLLSWETANTTDTPHRTREQYASVSISSIVGHS